MRPLLLVVLLAFLPAGSVAQEATVDRVEILGKGIYLVQAGAVTPDPDAPTGQITAPDIFTNVEATSTIPARVGVEFGFEYRIAGASDGADVALQLVNTFPAPGLVDPADPEPMLASKYERAKKIGVVNYVGYGFENDWELVPGTWTVEIWHGGRKLVDESFTIVKQ